METQFWIDSWNERGSKTSFHRPDIHPFVKKYAPPEFLADKRVLVPLAGKTNALSWFQHHATYTMGVELVEAPIHEFFNEHQLAYTNQGAGRFVGEKITFFQRNFFKLTVEDVGQVNFIYDRASLIAFPYQMRLDYLQKIDELTTTGAQILLITLEYDPYLDTPPFSITPAEIVDYYGQKYDINHVEDLNQPDHRM